MGLPGWQPPCLRARGSFCSCQSGNEGVTTTEEREESLPQYVAPSFSLYPPSPRDLSVPGALPSPDDAIPLVLQIPGSPSATYMSSLRGVSLPPSRPFYPARRPGIPVFPFRRPRVRAASPPNQYRQTS